MKRKVLLVDDDQDVLYGLARALRAQPYQLYTARSGAEAIDILKARPIDVVISDEQMPGMSGSDLIAWVAEHCPSVARIVLTGHATIDTAIRAINKGSVYRFFTKPCNTVALALAIRDALDHCERTRDQQRLLAAGNGPT